MSKKRKRKKKKYRRAVVHPIVGSPGPLVRKRTSQGSSLSPRFHQIQPATHRRDPRGTEFLLFFFSCTDAHLKETKLAEMLLHLIFYFQLQFILLSFFYHATLYDFVCFF